MKTLRSRVAESGAAFEDSGRVVPIRDDAEHDQSLVSAAVAKHMLVLLEMMLPKLVSETVVALERNANFRRLLHPRAQADGSRERRLNGIQLAAELGLGEWMVYGIKKANRIFHAQGKEPLIFTGRYASPSAVAKWLDDHPGFCAQHVLAPMKRKSKAEVRS